MCINRPRGSGVTTLAKNLSRELKVARVSAIQLLEKIVAEKREEESYTKFHSKEQAPVQGIKQEGSSYEHNSVGLSHSKVKGVTQEEFKAVTNHLLLGQKIPVEKCQEMLHSHLLHEFLADNKGFIIDYDMKGKAANPIPQNKEYHDKKEFTLNKSSKICAIQKEPTAINAKIWHRFQQQTRVKKPENTIAMRLPSALLSRGKLHCSGRASLGTLVHYHVHVDMVTSIEQQCRRDGE